MTTPPTIRSCSVELDAPVAETVRDFDIQNFTGRSTFRVPALTGIPDTWGLGLIVGPSGTGKSSLLRTFGRTEDVQWGVNKAVVSQFASYTDAKDRLLAVGFGSIPSWLRPYHVLSTGEQHRVDLARKIGPNAVVDEFTSVVDRNVAKAMARSLGRWASPDLRMVLATCHYDVIPYLNPSWVFDTANGGLNFGPFADRPYGSRSAVVLGKCGPISGTITI